MQNQVGRNSPQHIEEFGLIKIHFSRERPRHGSPIRERDLDWRIVIRIREVNQLLTGSGLSIADLLGLWFGGAQDLCGNRLQVKNICPPIVHLIIVVADLKSHPIQRVFPDRKPDCIERLVRQSR